MCDFDFCKLMKIISLIALILIVIAVIIFAGMNNPNEQKNILVTVAKSRR